MERGFTVTIPEPGTSSGDLWCWQVPPIAIPVYGMMALPQIQKMCDRMDGELHPNDILESCAKGWMQLFLLQRKERILIALLTEFVQYPQKKVLRVISIAGEKLILTRRYFPTVCTWAKANGAVAVETFATPETEFWDEAMGFKAHYRLMRKIL